MNLAYQILLALGITIITECIVFWIIIKKEPLKLLSYSLLINALTVPLANYSVNHLMLNIILVELCVILAESILIYLLVQHSYSRSLLLSILANIVSASMSLIFYI